jgi:hypothetical protein
MTTVIAARTKSPARQKSASALVASPAPQLNIAGEDRRRLIAEAAYFRAEQRGFVPGRELEDWLAAEIEVDALLGDDDGRT